MLSTRFVVLEHQRLDRSIHWDLLLMRPGDAAFTTFAIPPQVLNEEMKSFEVTGIPLPEHRLVYWEYEGVLSDERGHVHRIDRGEARFLGTFPQKNGGKPAEEWILNGNLLRGTLQIDRTAEGPAQIKFQAGGRFGL